MSAGDVCLNLMLDEINVRESHRPYDADAVSRLAKSIKDIGLQYPISVVREGKRFMLVAGRHRLEAVRALGFDRIPAQIAIMGDREARMWEIAENLHRAELTTEQRYEQIAEYTRLAKEKREAEKPAHSAHVYGGRGNQGGDSAAARDLGLSRDQIRRAQDYAALPDDVKEQAIADGVNVTTLLRKPVPPSDPPRNEFELINAEHRALVSAWEKARPEARNRFLSDIGAILDIPVFDKSRAGTRA